MKMTIDKALQLFQNQNKEKLIPTEYCVVKEGIVINTKSIFIRPNTCPAQYLVTNDGQVYPTNPMLVEYTEFYKIKR